MTVINNDYNYLAREQQEEEEEEKELTTVMTKEDWERLKILKRADIALKNCMDDQPGEIQEFKKLIRLGFTGNELVPDHSNTFLHWTTMYRKWKLCELLLVTGKASLNLLGFTVCQICLRGVKKMQDKRWERKHWAYRLSRSEVKVDNCIVFTDLVNEKISQYL